jgi:hypothetical protein
LVKQACLAGFFGRHGHQSNRNSISALLPSFQLLNTNYEIIALPMILIINVIIS